MKNPFVAIWYDGSSEREGGRGRRKHHATLVDVGDVPFGKMPEEMGLPSAAQVIALIEAPDPDGLLVVVGDLAVPL